jgi:hypothetical protein
MIVGPTQCFFVILLITAFVGLSRGWVREIITMAIVLGTVLFLLNGGDGLLHQFLFVNVPTALHDLIFGTSPTTVPTPPISVPAQTRESVFGVVTFFILIALAYLAGQRWGSAPTTNQHRLGGILPGLVTGAAISYYVSNAILPSTEVDLTSPTDTLTRVYLPIILGIGLLGMVLVLLLARGSKGGSGGSGGAKH